MMFQMGKIIRQLRNQNKMTQEELAAGIVSKSVISRIENGQVEPNFSVLMTLLNRLGKSLKPFEFVVTNKEYVQIKEERDSFEFETIIVAEGDLYKDIRESRNLSQEQFSSDIYARETISNIENGRTPRRKKVHALMEKQGFKLEKIYGFVIAQEYEVYELVEQFYESLKSNVEKSALLRKEIQLRIDETLPLNRQFLESTELFIKWKKEEISSGEMLAGLERCLRYTMPRYDGQIYRIPFRQEVIILQEIIKQMKHLQRIKAAEELDIELQEKMCKKTKISCDVTALKKEL